MAISFVAAGAVATGTNPTVAVPAGLQAFDLLLIITTGTATPTTPTGWTQVAAQGAGRFLTVLYKITTTGTESSVNLALSGTTAKSVMLAYRGSGNYDVVSTFTTATATTLATATQTTRLNNDYVLSIYSNASGAARTWTAPGSTTSRVNSATTSTVNGLLVVDESQATAGATTARTATISASSALAAVSISIREPQTLYWTGTGNWSSTTLWKTTSGGATTIGAPTQNDDVVFDSNGTSCTIAAASACTNFTIDGTFAGTIAGTSTLAIAGSYVEDVSGGFTWSYSGSVTFNATTTGKTLTTNVGNLVAFLNNNITFNGLGGGWTIGGQLGSNTKALTLTAGALDLNDQILGFTTFTASGSAVRSLNSGPTQAGLISLLSNSGTVVTLNGTNITVTGSITYECQVASVSASARTIDLNTFYTESNAPSLTIYNSNDTPIITAPVVNNLTFQDTGTGTSTISNSATTSIYGGLNIANSARFTFNAGTFPFVFASTSGATNQIVTSGETLDFPITFSGVGGVWQLQDALTVGSARNTTLTAGTLDLNSNNLTTGAFFSTNTNTRTIAYGTGQIYITGLNATVFSMGTVTGLTVTGTPVVNVTGSGTAGQTRIFAIGNTAGGSAAIATSLNVTAGADTISIGAGSYLNNLSFSSFTGTLGSLVYFIYGNLTLATGMTVTASTNPTVFAATSGTKTITSNGVLIDNPVTFNGVGGTWQLQDALTVGSTRTITLTNGTLNLNNNNLTTGLFNTNNSNVRGITTGTGSFYITGNNGTVVNLNTVTNFTLTGTLNFYCTYAGATGTRTISAFGTTVNSNYYITAGTDTFTLTGNRVYNDINFTGFGGTISSAGTGGVSIFGNFTGPTAGSASGTVPLYFIVTKNITTGGITYDIPFQFGQGASGGVFTFLDALTMGATNGSLTFVAGTLTLKAGTTNTVGSFITSGTNIKNLRSTTAGVQATLSQASGTVTATYLNIQDSNATGGATWDATAASNVNSGNNTGWLFSGGALTAAIVEAMSAGDTYAAAVLFYASTVENFSALDTESVQLTAAGSITENSGLADTEAAQLTISRDITENSGLADTEAAQLTASGAITENSGLADVKTVQVNFNSTRTENIVLADTQNIQVNFYVDRTEPLTMADLESASFVLAVSISEGSTLANSQLSINVFVATATENSGLADTQSYNFAFSSTITESISSVSDIQSALRTIAGSLVENSGLASVQSASATFKPSAVEGVDVASTQAAQASFSATTVEDSGLNDIISALKTLTSSIAENSGLGDSTAYFISFNANAVEGFVLVDSAYAQNIFNGEIDENMVLSDQLIGYGWFKIVDDQIADWGVVNNTNAAVWATIANNQTANWSNIDNTQSITWSNIGDDENPNWVQINNTQP